MEKPKELSQEEILAKYGDTKIRVSPWRGNIPVEMTVREAVDFWSGVGWTARNSVVCIWFDEDVGHHITEVSYNEAWRKYNEAHRSAPGPADSGKQEKMK